MAIKCGHCLIRNCFKVIKDLSLLMPEMQLKASAIVAKRKFSCEDEKEPEPICCKAAVKFEKDGPFCVETIEVAPPKEHEVRVKIIASGVCHTDHYNFGDFEHEGVFPCIRGHEGGGIVESVGPCVRNFKPGDHCIPLFMPQCGECHLCKNPKTNLCAKIAKTQHKGLMPDGTSRFSIDGEPVYHFMGTSTFSQYTVVPDFGLAKINPKAPLEIVCLLGCGIPTGYGASLNNAKVEKGSVCAVWGLGTVGLASVLGCKKAGAIKIYGIDTNSEKCEVGKKFGMTDFVNPQEVKDKGPLAEYLRAITNGGFDYTLECVGLVSTMTEALESTAYWGTSCIVGVDPSANSMKVRPYQLLEGRIWTGSPFGGWQARADVPKLVEDYLKKELMVKEFITHTMPLDEINEAFNLMLKGKSTKSVLLMHC